MENDLTLYQPVITEIKGIILTGRQNAYSAANSAMLLTYWNVGKQIVEQEQNGADRAAYGKGLIRALADELTKEFRKGYSERNLRNFRKFYQMFPNREIWQTRLPNLTIREHLIKFTEIAQIPLGVAFSKLFCQFIRQGANQPFSIRGPIRTILFLFYNLLSYVPIGQQHSGICGAVRVLPSRQNDSFYLRDNRLV